MATSVSQSGQDRIPMRKTRVFGMGLLLALLLWGGLWLWNNRWRIDMLFVACQPALEDAELSVRLLLIEYQQPCNEFYWLPYTGGEFHNRIHINNYGLNDDNLTLAKPDGEFRVLMVGDEATLALEVAQEETFTRLAEDQLNQREGDRVNVINLSQRGFGTDRELLYYAALGASFQPEVVVLVINLENDILNNNVALETHASGIPPVRPYFTLDDGDLTLHNSPTLNPRGATNSAYQWLLNMQAEQVDAEMSAPPLRPRVMSDDPRVLQYPLELGAYLPDDPQWADAWALTEALILTFRDLADAQGARFGVVLMTGALPLEQARWQNALNQYFVLRNAEPFAPTERMAAFLDDHDIPAANVVYTLQMWLRTHYGERLYYYWDGSLNPLGHQLAGERIANWLVAEGLVP